MSKIKGLFTHLGKKAKYAAAMMGVGCTTALTAIVSSAEGAGLSSYSDQIISQFTSAADDIVPIVVGVLGAGLGIFVIFVGIKLAKKMFTTVSK